MPYTVSQTTAVSREGAGADVGAGAGSSPILREEFRAIAEMYNEQNVCLLRLPPDCWDMTTKYLSYMDVVALGQACRSLWAVLHKLESVWLRQLSYFYHDVRGLRGGKLLCTAPLFPELPYSHGMSRQGSRGTLTGLATGQEWSRKASRQSHISAYERFFQERRVYVLDSHREWHFQELADVADKPTGMFTVALHDGHVEAVATTVSPPPPLLPSPTSTSASITTSPIFESTVGGMREWLSPAPLPPASFAASPTPTPPHHRTTSTQINGTSAGSSPALAPVAAPPTPPLLPRVGEPIINDHNPLLRLRVYTIEPVRAERSRDNSAAEVAAEASRSDDENHRSGASPASNIAATLAGMTEEQVIEYVMRLSLEETQQAAAQPSPAPPTDETPSNVNPAAADMPDSVKQRQRELYQHRHYRGANPASSLPLSELFAVLDAFTNNAHDQLQYYRVRDCTKEEDPAFLQRLSETLRSAKHRRLHLGNHHRAVRNNGQTTRNRAGRSAGVSLADGSSVSLSASTAAGTATPPQQPPPMNRMLHGFHGDLLEITEREAQLVAGTLLGMPRVINEFVAFRCYDPALLYRRLHPSNTAIDRTDTQGTPREALKATPPLKDRFVLSDALSPINRQTTEAGSSGVTHQSTETPAAHVVATTRTPPLKPLPFFTRFFLAPELCHDGYVALFVVDVVRALVIVEKEVVTTDNPDWASPLIARGGRVVVHGQGYNAQAYIRDEYNYVPLNPTRRQRGSDSSG
uniref:F-box domain-containing protein n=1 Tax=Leishmania guyanensis TaxID=5670 RepID=A0A1E1J4Q4_LEIGU|nr:hypothetical protein, conserved [Leishmania guyanensis]